MSVINAKELSDPHRDFVIRAGGLREDFDYCDLGILKTEGKSQVHRTVRKVSG